MKKLLIIGISFFLISRVFGLDFSLSLEPQFSYHYGNYDEYVFEKNDNDTLYMLSHLDWDMSFFSVGFTSDLSLGFANKQHLSLIPSLHYGFPQKSGFMQDYDWQNYDGVLTDYSCHSNLLDFYINAGLALHYTLSCGIGFSLDWQFQTRKFIAQGGYKDYPLDESQPNWEYGENERVVEYTPKSHLVGLGVFYTARLLPTLELRTIATYIPFIHTVAQDYHVWGRTFIDIMTGYVGYRGQLMLSHLFSEKARLSLSLYYEHIPVLKGENLMREEYQSSFYKTSALGGASWKDFSVTLSYRHEFF
ncbi:MAG: omptin family outer membrane protease [Spirochaetaceae bacterium]|nr:omptin family outer membrane protease [Spirochaetaceae bacterium]